MRRGAACAAAPLRTLRSEGGTLRSEGFDGRPVLRRNDALDATQPNRPVLRRNDARDEPGDDAPGRSNAADAFPPAPPLQSPLPIGAGTAWNLVISQNCLSSSSNNASEDVELLASNLCAALSQELHSKWLLCEVFQADAATPKLVSRFAAEEHFPKAVPELRLKLGVTPDRACYGCIRPPRGHCCTKCLDLPLARVLRNGVESTFAPGVGLVGRCWATKRAEVLDLAVARCFPETYNRTAAWDVGHLRTVVAVPIARRGVHWCDDVPESACAVVLIYFGDALLKDVSQDDAVPRGLQAAMARASAAALKRQKAKTLLRPVPPLPPAEKRFSAFRIFAGNRPGRFDRRQ
ncbi:hypothetical protein M885DRAFT_547519 [Pelagophyceae sp. CCMP2097]|nr:hypothetical protein M885DRAFT_547519 [Pelagophyceae sp. CCMP2097]|mmetsp:Transcript_4058/g.12551  ORF Transcript_4058/g.12551 Transcript_4058/m.12551 type:complete len:349 (-) Transcript_4058:50-1096(-)